MLLRILVTGKIKIMLANIHDSIANQIPTKTPIKGRK